MVHRSHFYLTDLRALQILNCSYSMNRINRPIPTTVFILFSALVACNYYYSAPSLAYVEGFYCPLVVVRYKNNL